MCKCILCHITSAFEKAKPTKKGEFNIITNLIATTSITYALKAKNLLKSRGIRCEIVRTPKNFSSGCGYSVKIFTTVDEVLPVLEGAGIKWKDFTDNRKENEA